MNERIRESGEEKGERERKVLVCRVIQAEGNSIIQS